jgi:hypothetical protein
MLAAIAAFAAAAPAQAEERRFTVTSFDRIIVEGPFEIVLATGRPSAVTASGTNLAIERVSIEVQGRTLRIRPNKSAWGGYPGQSAGTVKLSIGTHELSAATVSGSGSLAIDRAKGMRFAATVAGSGRIGIGNVEADTLTIGLMGSGKISLAGKAKELVAAIQGSGDLDAQKLTADDAKIAADTAGTISVAVKRAAEVTATGVGETIILGKPACTLKGQGAGRVACGG